MALLTKSAQLPGLFSVELLMTSLRGKKPPTCPREPCVATLSPVPSHSAWVDLMITIPSAFSSGAAAPFIRPRSAALTGRFPWEDAEGGGRIDDCKRSTPGAGWPTCYAFSICPRAHLTPHRLPLRPAGDGTREMQTWCNGASLRVQMLSTTHPRLHALVK